MRTLVIGGARSGKSRAAEGLLAEAAEVTYVATAYQPGNDVEWQERVALHRARRPGHWATLETLDLAGLLTTDGGPLLVDCLTLWLTRMMDRHGCWDDEVWSTGGSRALRAEVDALLGALRSSARDVVLVTNEVGQGVVPATASGRRFRDEMGVLNTAVAAECGDVLWCVAGRVVRL
jgi:adenosylcobinamide kinase / adenosylcobinamide-phosphate guanylyltransferase